MLLSSWLALFAMDSFGQSRAATHVRHRTKQRLTTSSFATVMERLEDTQPADATGLGRHFAE